MSDLTQTLEVVDAITDDLENIEPELPTHGVVKHGRPAVIAPKDVPLLVVWWERDVWRLLATPSTYIVTPEIHVGWFVSISEQSESGEGFGAVIEQHADTRAAIMDRLVSYAQGIPTMTDRAWGRITESRPDRPSAMVLGLVARLEVEF